MKYNITGSIVLYRNNRKMLSNAINSFLKTTLDAKLYLIDNSPTDELKDISDSPRVQYHFNNANVGFGAGHNVALKKAMNESSFHLILNPDIVFGDNVLERIVTYMQANPDVGILMPKILNEDGSVQLVAKLLPTPFDFIARRFIPRSILKKLPMNDKFELVHSGYNRIMEVPFLSGCFMVFNTKHLQEVGLFDENIFMYTEDIDICRRFFIKHKAIFFPEVTITHLHERKSFTNMKTFLVYFRSAVYYFNKWGWFADKERREINRKTLSQFK